MEATSEFDMLDILTPEMFGMIFSKLSLKEKLEVIPTTCKLWRNVINGRYCWQDIDIVEWSNNCEPHRIERIVEMLIRRSSGSLHKLCVSGLQTEGIFTFIAENVTSLQTLRLPRCNVNDYIVELITGRLSMITTIDLSYCINIGADAIEIIGKNCKGLEGFCRNMHPSDTSDQPPEDAEAFSIASTMPNLKRVEMVYHRISNDGVYQILALCPELEHLDMRGCWSVTLKNKFLKDNYPQLKVLGPQVFDYYDDCSDISSDSGDMDENAVPVFEYKHDEDNGFEDDGLDWNEDEGDGFEDEGNGFEDEDEGNGFEDDGLQA